MIRKLLHAAGAFLTLPVSQGFAAAGPRAEAIAQGRVLFEKACVVCCHDAERMAAEKPGHLTEAESAEIAAYLSAARPLP
jgi:hypothetical protein